MHDHMQDLMVRGTPRGYFEEPIKSILVISLLNIQQLDAHFQGMGVWVVTVSRYLGGFIGDQESEKNWLAEKVKVWMHSVEVLIGVALRHPQTAYNGLQKSPHQDWAFIQSVTTHIGEAIRPVEEALEKYLLPGHHRRSSVLRDHPPACQAGGAGNSKPKSFRQVKLGGLICRHRTPGCSSPQAERVQNQGSLHAPV